MELVPTKPVFEVFDKIVIQTSLPSWKIESSLVASLDMVLSNIILFDCLFD